MKRRLLTIFCTLVLGLGLLPTAQAAGPIYLALGDSISTGYAPPAADGTAQHVSCPFANQVADTNGYSLDNQAANGETTATLYEKLPRLSGSIASASVITLTIGGNDLIDTLYDYLAARYPQEAICADEAKELLLRGDVDFLSFAVEVISDWPDSAQTRDARSTFEANLTAIVDAIKTVNPDVTLLVATQYNPYRYPAQAYGLLFKPAVTISNAFSAVAEELNSTILRLAPSLDFAVADVYTAFEEAVAAGVNPCNASLFSLDFHPNQIGHDLIAAAINRVLSEAELAALPFSDVAENAWYADAVDFVYESGLMAGTSGTAFSPESAMTRAMILTILARLDGVAPSAGDAWYAAGVAWAVERGISDGANLEQNLTREQLAAMLWRYVGSPAENGSISSFADAGAVSPWAADAMSWAVEHGIFAGTGDGSTLSPQGDVTRAQAAAILMRFVPILTSVSKHFDTLLKHASIFSRGCRPPRALADARTLTA